MPYSLYDPSVWHDELESAEGFSFLERIPVDWNARVAEVQALKQEMGHKRDELRVARVFVGELERDAALAENAYRDAWKALKRDMGDGDGEAQ